MLSEHSESPSCGLLEIIERDGNLNSWCKVSKFFKSYNISTLHSSVDPSNPITPFQHLI